MVNLQLSFQVYSGVFEVIGYLPVRTAIEHGYVPQPASTGDVPVDENLTRLVELLILCVLEYFFSERCVERIRVT